jgi:Protein of unknown function (DUF3489)
MDVFTAVITAEGENMISIAEETRSALAPVTNGKPKAVKKATVAPHGGNVAKKKAKSAKKTHPAKKAPKSATKAPKSPTKVTAGREGSKTTRILELLRQPGGVTAQELMKITEWQAHSVRAFLSGTIRRKMRLEVVSTKGEDGERRYSVKA